jgi:hypothetical protein
LTWIDQPKEVEEANVTPVAIKNWSMAQKKGHQHGSKRATKDGFFAY